MAEITKRITEEIDGELRAIQSYLEDTPADEPSILLDRLTMLNSYMARTGYLLAEAKADLDAATAGVFAKFSNMILKMPATVSQKFITSQCETENYYVAWIERINRSCVHQSDNIRTQVSFAKENLNLTRRGY